MAVRPSQAREPVHSRSFGVVRKLPRTQTEAAQAHEAHRHFECQPLNTGDAAEVAGLRQLAISVSLDILPSDATALPRLSRGTIRDYLDQNFLFVAARLERDEQTSHVHLHPKPLAGTGGFSGDHSARVMMPAVLESVRDMHSLGLFVRPDVTPAPQLLRTLVMLHKKMITSPGRGGTLGEQPRASYEFLVMRAVPDEGRPGASRLALHSFCTTDDRSTWHYLPSFSWPHGVFEASIKGTVKFTEFDRSSGLMPISAVTRGTSPRSRATFSLDELNAYCAAQNWKGDALENLAEVLDAIIAGELTPTRR